MDSLFFYVVVTGILGILTLVTGIWLTQAGKPYHVLLSSIHKIASLFIGVFTAIAIYRWYKIGGLATTQVAVIAITLLFFLLSFISGILQLSLNKETKPVLVIHRIFPFLTTITLVLTFYLLIKQ